MAVGLLGLIGLSGCLPPGSTITLTVPPAPTASSSEPQRNDAGDGRYQPQAGPESPGASAQSNQSDGPDKLGAPNPGNPDPYSENQGVDPADPSGSSADPYAENSNVAQRSADSMQSDEAYPAEPYTDSPYTDGSYTDGSYTDGSYTDGSYTDGSYTDGSYTDEPYASDPYSDDPYSDDSSQAGMSGDTGVANTGGQGSANLPVRYGKQNLPASLIERLTKP